MPCRSQQGEVAVKGTASGNFICTAPCAVGSSSISIDICTPHSCSSNPPELLDNGRKNRFYYGFLERVHTDVAVRLVGVIGHGLFIDRAAVGRQPGWLDNHGNHELILWG
jgi:hypothetical protein